MRSIFHRPAQAMPAFGSDEQLGRLEMLATLSTRQRNQALRFLSGHAPEVFDAILGEVGPGEADQDERDEYEPACGFCAERLGVFAGTGPYWLHYRGEDPGGPFRIVDPGHDPVITWRIAAGIAAVS